MDNLIEQLKELIIKAGEIALTRKKHNLIIEHKGDKSPVTNADKEIDQLISATLMNLVPDANIISEEGNHRQLYNEKFWLVDPIDGTKSYIEGKNTYTVNIAFVEHNIPKIGLIYQPEEQKLYYTDHNGKLKIEHNGIDLPLNHIATDRPYVAVIGSKMNNEIKNILNNWIIDEIQTYPSSLKLCYIAEGVADVYPSLSQKMEWDIAAGHALINASGGKIEDINGNPVQYGQKAFTAPYFYAYSKRWVEKLAGSSRL